MPQDDERRTMLPSEGFLATDDQVRLYFQRAGSGQSTLIIPNAVYLFDDFKSLGDTRTVISYDLRNRGRSDAVSETAKLKRGIQQDVDDLEAVRRQLGADRIDLIGHSYLGMMVILYAMKYPTHVHRVVAIGPAQVNAATQFPAHLTGADATLRDVGSKLVELQKTRDSKNAVEFCKEWWSIARAMYVADPADAGKIAHWGFCDLPNERSLAKYWAENIFPSIQGLTLTAEDFSRATAPVLIIHGRRDRNAPYGGAREWASLLPNAKLMTVDNAAHVPWIEAPGKVFESVRTFLDGKWPETAESLAAVGE